ncbi:hypothetical protein C3F22_08135 [Acinetobacter sp. ACNIH1]|nr:hypothetical protein C3F22_08135 [Acinetobacter sp. ACNIH1]
MTNNEIIKIHIDAKTKQLAEQAAVVLGYSALSEFYFRMVAISLNNHRKFKVSITMFFKGCII